MTWAAFEKAVRAEGLTAVDHGNGHWQVVGGAVLVNYYPEARRGATVYVAGEVRSQAVAYTAAEVIQFARQGPKLALVKAERKSARWRRAVKRRLLAKDPRCRWCRCPLTPETATLEHILPLARGGSNYDNNLALACQPCNVAKGHAAGAPKARPQVEP